MTKKEQDNILKSFKNYRDKVLSSKETAKKFLEESGIITKSGKLTTEYK